MPDINGKALLTSKTFWFNVIFIIVTIAGYFGYADFEPDSKVVEILGTVFAIGNILIRTVTKEPITRIK